MLDTLLATLAIVITWAAWAAAFVAIGAVVFPRGVAGRAPASAFAAQITDDGEAPTRLLVWFWSGWCVVVLFLQVWHLALPVDARAVAAVASAAAIALWLRRSEFLHAVRAARAAGTPTLLAAAVLAVAWANLATGEIRVTDTGLYHIQAARWNAAYPIVPGLGNLHGRLAYNNASLLYAALADAGPWSHRGHHIANGLLALAVVLPLLPSIPKALATPSRRDGRRDGQVDRPWLRHVARSLLVAPTLLHAYKHATSLSPDLPATMLGTVLAVVLIDLCLVRAAPSPAQADETARVPMHPTAAASLVALLSATAISVKLSTIATAGVATLVALALVRPTLVRGLLVAAVFLVAIGPWCARGVVLSGYLAYPSQAVAFDVPWRVPSEWAEEDRRTIVAWARDPNRSATEVLADTSWFRPWAWRQLRDVLGVSLPLLVIAVCAALVVHHRRTVGPTVAARTQLWPAALPFVAAIAFLLATAPDIARFGGASLWIIAVVCATTWLGEQHAASPGKGFRKARSVAIVLSAALVLIAAAKTVRYLRLAGGFAPIPQAELRTVRTDSGLSLHVPTDSDRAWDAPLPSTPYPKPQLALRRPGDLAAGFEHRQAR